MIISIKVTSHSLSKKKKKKVTSHSYDTLWVALSLKLWTVLDNQSLSLLVVWRDWETLTPKKSRERERERETWANEVMKWLQAFPKGQGLCTLTSQSPISRPPLRFVTFSLPHPSLSLLLRIPFSTSHNKSAPFASFNLCNLQPFCFFHLT